MLTLHGTHGQGKKWNALRRRCDTCEYEIDQLLLGTLGFSLHFFLFPNIAGFYIFFALVWAHAVAVQTAIALFLVLLNHSPVRPLSLPLL